MTNEVKSGEAMGGKMRLAQTTFAQAARFWEPLRIAYNVALVGVVFVWVVATWPHFQPALKWSSLLPMSVLALIANVLYCAAYLVDVPLQHAARKFLGRGRWILWTVGTLFAIVLSSYWIVDEIYPDFH